MTTLVLHTPRSQVSERAEITPGCPVIVVDNEYQASA